MQIAKDERTWKEKVEEVAAKFSQVVEERFVGSVMRAESFLPATLTDESDGENRVELLEYFIDYSVGTVVALLTHYASTSEQFEENFVAMVRDKFARLRKMKAAQDGEAHAGHQ